LDTNKDPLTQNPQYKGQASQIPTFRPKNKAFTSHKDPKKKKIKIFPLIIL